MNYRISLYCVCSKIFLLYDITCIDLTHNDGQLQGLKVTYWVTWQKSSAAAASPVSTYWTLWRSTHLCEAALCFWLTVHQDGRKFWFSGQVNFLQFFSPKMSWLHILPRYLGYSGHCACFTNWQLTRIWPSHVSPYRMSLKLFFDVGVYVIWADVTFTYLK